MAHVFLIDNFDSFTYNLVHQFQVGGARVTVVRHDQGDWRRIFADDISHIVVSPGPGGPERTGISKEVLETYWTALPILGVCLGHQLLGQMSGARVVQAIEPVHGKASKLRHDASAMFSDCSETPVVGRYHSLVLEAVPESFRGVAYTASGELMAMAHCEHRIWGVQFHPESILTPEGDLMIRLFLQL